MDFFANTKQFVQKHPIFEVFTENYSPYRGPSLASGFCLKSHNREVGTFRVDGVRFCNQAKSPNPGLEVPPSPEQNI